MKTGSKNILYYNAIANEYNEMLDTIPDKIVRNKVADKFCSAVNDGVILDFGGGTGLDIQWLTDKNFTIFFCEPAIGMRERAISAYSNLPQHKIIFLDDSATDFRQWHLQLPFPTQVDAVLCNFAVLNCIPDIELLFQNLALVIKPGADMIALVLSKKLKNKLNITFRSILKSFISYRPTTLNLTYKKHRQTVYVYSIKEIIKAASKKFSFCSSEILPGSGFTLIHLRRK